MVRPGEVPVVQDGLAVLLAEDNRVNAMVISRLLRGFGCHVRHVETGAAAVEAALAGRFDIILLDLQMPDIDGFEVARFVRKTIKSPASQIPIVALTADAFTETRQLTQAAGMNDFITKPFRQKDLLRVLRKFSSQDHDSRPEEAFPMEHPVNAVIDFEFIKDKFGKDPETFRYILGVFIDDIATELTSVRDLLESASGMQAVRVVHKLVSTFSAMGMPETAFTVSLVERLLKANEDTILIREKWSQVELEYQTARQQARIVLETLAA
jgi:CheY-like chemotaxis protein/HPt (histidine-containing phosphotransfer) domain-containing protein